MNPTSNAILERMHLVIASVLRIYSIKDTYTNKYDMCSFILADAAFVVISTTNILKVFSLGQLIFVSDTILLLKHTMDCGLIRQ